MVTMVAKKSLILTMPALVAKNVMLTMLAMVAKEV